MAAFPFFDDSGVLNASADYSFQNQVKLYNAAGAKALISCGGWTGGVNLSFMVALPRSRQKFIKWNIDYIFLYNLTGVDLDWEYPNDPGPDSNQYCQDVKDVVSSAFVPYVDRFQVMVFDLNSASDRLSSSANAPFMAVPGKGPPYGPVESTEYWYATGEPYSKFVDGISFLGHARTLLVTNGPTIQYNPAEM
ncbi:hypothetical protein MAM1_0412c10396 [Mucor ambiguus]|uniref:GH18 domain-containing protein n=1 Tax=Mucor ambiguus TaxID=91626 RepID=A0A0C9MJ26_9FUNG|nr:hypothetical protein MAM1_0412c10396 [Mucor ambiguus]